MEANEIVKALRCRAGDDSGCSGKCPYLLTEPISEDLAELLGIKPGEVQRSCDADQIALDAADLIEKQAVEIQALRGAANSLKAASQLWRRTCGGRIRPGRLPILRPLLQRWKAGIPA